MMPTRRHTRPLWEVPWERTEGSRGRVSIGAADRPRCEKVAVALWIHGVCAVDPVRSAVPSSDEELRAAKIGQSFRELATLREVVGTILGQEARARLVSHVAGPEDLFRLEGQPGPQLPLLALAPVPAITLALTLTLTVALALALRKPSGVLARDDDHLVAVVLLRRIHFLGNERGRTRPGRWRCGRVPCIATSSLQQSADRVKVRHESVTSAHAGCRLPYATSFRGEELQVQQEMS
eukprot:scaffold1237_cov243-Pinguiococcus_pyrenoidosus.AAC.47